MSESICWNWEVREGGTREKEKAMLLNSTMLFRTGLIQHRLGGD